MIRTHLPSYRVHDKFCARLFPVCATEEFYRASVALERCQQQMNQQTWFTWVVRSLSFSFDSIHTVFVSLDALICLQSKGRKEQEKGTDSIGILFHQSKWEISSPCHYMMSSDISHSSWSPKNVNSLRWETSHKVDSFCARFYMEYLSIRSLSKHCVWKKSNSFLFFPGVRRMKRVCVDGRWVSSRYCEITRRQEKYRCDKEKREWLWTVFYSSRLSSFSFLFLSFFFSTIKHRRFWRCV